MDSFNRPLIGMINKYLGPKVAALITGTSVLGAQFTEFYTSITASLPFSPAPIELIKQFALNNNLLSLLPAPLIALVTYYFRRAPHHDKINDIIRKEEDAKAYEKDFARDILNKRKVDLSTSPGNDAVVERGDNMDLTYVGDMKEDLDRLRLREYQNHDRTEFVDEALDEYYAPLADDFNDTEVSDELYEDHERSQLHPSEIDPNYDREAAERARQQRDEVVRENDYLRQALAETDEKAAKERDELRMKVLHLEDKLQAQLEDPPKSTNIVELQDSIIQQIESDHILPLEERLAIINENIDSYVEAIDKKFNLINDVQRNEILKDAPNIIKPHDFWPNDTQSELEKYFGKMGYNQAMLQLPYVMQLAWDKETEIQRFSCHEKVAEAWDLIFNRTLDHYGEDGIKELGLDQFGGCLNVRLMRGSDHRYSTHSWGIAVDLDPDRNQMKAEAPDARLSHPDAEPFWGIVESTGMHSSGRVRGFDYMHVQAASFSR